MSHIISRSVQWKLFAVAAILIWMNTYFVQRFYFKLQVTTWFQELIMIINPLSSTLLLLGIAFLIFKRRQHWAVMITAFFTSTVLFVNLLFYRFYNDFITLPVLFQSRNAKGLGSSVYSLIEWQDVFIFLAVMVLAILLVRRKLPVVQLRRKQLKPVFVAVFCLMMVNLAMSEMERPDLLARSFDRPLIVKNIGTFNYHIYDLVINSSMETKRVFASSADMNVAGQYLSQKKHDEVSPLFGVAEGKNVFLISMESIQNFVIGTRLHGQEITPFLNSLIQNNSFYFDNLYHQTGQGKTSDAEFIMDNSLYPLPSGAVYFTHTENTFLSMPKILKEHGYYSAVFHANDRTFWNRDIMYDSLGYDQYFDKESYDIHEDNSVGWGLKDIPFFEQAVSLAAGLEQPFYAKMITLTNHFPYEYEEEDKWIEPFDSGDESVDRYFVTVRYLDEAMKHFFQQVKRQGLYENSIFVLYGDHYGISNNHSEAMAQFLGKEEMTPFDELQLQKVPVIIHIPGVEGETIHSVSGQIDVRPTILHLLGLHDGDDLSFGHDLLAPNRPSFAVLRDGSFVADDVVSREDVCYNKADGSEIDFSHCQPYEEHVTNELNHSDQIIYGDLLRFILNTEDTP